MKRDFEKLVDRMVENARVGIAFERKIEPILRQPQSADAATGNDSFHHERNGYFDKSSRPLLEQEETGLTALKAS